MSNAVKTPPDPRSTPVQVKSQPAHIVSSCETLPDVIVHTYH